MEMGALRSQQIPRGPARRKETGDPPGALPESPWAPLIARHPDQLASLPGPLTDSADTQATKPKVSRIHARCIFPGDQLLPAAACSEGETKPPLVLRSAQPAQRNREPSSRSDRDWGSGLGARGFGALDLSSCACSRRPRCAPGMRRLLTCWFPHCRRGVGASERLLSTSSSCSAGFFTPPRTPSPCRDSVSDFQE